MPPLATSIQEPPSKQPRAWLLIGHKAGDNAQLLALAEALGWQFETRRMRYRPWELLTTLLSGASLAGINRGQSSPLAPPWPDLVITAGRRNESVARWIHRQSAGATRLVQIGRPWAALDQFDLIITTPQYQLPERPIILHNSLPLHGITPARLAQAASDWAPRLEHLPRPWIGVLIGGDSGPFVFTPQKGARLGRLVNKLATRDGGSLLITDSARTPTAAFDAFAQQLQAPAWIFRWTAGARDNPYHAYLGLADTLVVTGESMSMMTEASATGKPLYIFDPADAPDKPWWQHPHNFRYKPLSHRLGMWLGPRRMMRDVRGIQQQLVATGRAAWLGDSLKQLAKPTALDDLHRAVERVKALFA